MRDHVKIFKALSDKNRLRILKMLEVKPLCVCEITAVLGLATSTVSKHLSLLKDAGLINERKEGKWVTYFLEDKPAKTIAQDMLMFIRKTMNDAPQAVSDRKTARKTDRARICRS